LSVLENVMLALAAQAGKNTACWRPLYRGQWLEHGAAVRERFGLQAYARRPVAALPKGGRKLLDIALSFALHPQLLLMDEPTSGVSIEDKFQVMETLVTTTHKSTMGLLPTTNGVIHLDGTDLVEVAALAKHRASA
jgi:branched-chain amino acid transport system ATP-binding protein